VVRSLERSLGGRRSAWAVNSARLGWPFARPLVDVTRDGVPHPLRARSRRRPAPSPAGQCNSSTTRPLGDGSRRPVCWCASTHFCCGHDLDARRKGHLANSAWKGASMTTWMHGDGSWSSQVQTVPAYKNVGSCTARRGILLCARVWGFNVNIVRELMQRKDGGVAACMARCVDVFNPWCWLLCRRTTTLSRPTSPSRAAPSRARPRTRLSPPTTTPLPCSIKLVTT